MNPITTLTIALLLPLLSWSQVKCPCEMSTVRKVDEEISASLCDATRTGENAQKFIFNTNNPTTSFFKILEEKVLNNACQIESIEQYHACIAEWIRMNYDDFDSFACDTGGRFKGNSLLAYVGRNNHADIHQLLDELSPYGVEFLQSTTTATVMAWKGEYIEMELNLLDLTGVFVLTSVSSSTIYANCVLNNRLRKMGFTYSEAGPLTAEMKKEIEEKCEGAEDTEDEW